MVPRTAYDQAVSSPARRASDPPLLRSIKYNGLAFRGLPIASAGGSPNLGKALGVWIPLGLP